MFFIIDFKKYSIKHILLQNIFFCSLIINSVSTHFGLYQKSIEVWYSIALFTMGIVAHYNVRLYPTLISSIFSHYALKMYFKWHIKIFFFFMNNYKHGPATQYLWRGSWVCCNRNQGRKWEQYWHLHWLTSWWTPPVWIHRSLFDTSVACHQIVPVTQKPLLLWPRV